jgi:hypothetical protein
MTKFRMTSSRLYWWPVTVSFPDPDTKKAGQVIEQEFNAQFEESDRDAGRAFDDEMAKLSPLEREGREHEWLIGRTKGWDENVVDEKEQPIPFTETALRAAMRSNYFRVGLYTAYAQSQTGSPKRPSARAGN